MNKTGQENKQRIYCAIYTRKSTTEGLDQDFTSLDAQRESAINYINSQKHEGWVPLPTTYDDGGFTGASIERPGLQKLLNNIKQGGINCVVVYKVDRLSRSLMDFAQLLEFFDKNNVTFVSVTQQFNTNTSMGRLTLNILLSFAQFEREIISERTRDKMGAARRKGKWVGGLVPLGYSLDKPNKKLIVNNEEVELVKEIFALFIKGNSLLKVSQLLNDKGYRTKLTAGKTGRGFGGIKYGKTHIQSLITNVVYIGKVCFAGKIYDGEQPAIIDEDTFRKAQEQLKINTVERRATKNMDCTGLLSNLIKCKACGTFLYHTYTRKGKHKYRYYVCTSAQKRGYHSCPTTSINAQAFEETVINCLLKLYTDAKIDNHKQKTEIEAFLSPVWNDLFPDEKKRIIKSLVREISYNTDSKRLCFSLSDNTHHEFDVDLKNVRPMNKWHKEVEIDKEPRVRRNLILAHQLQHLMDTGRIKSMKQASEWLGLSEIRISQVLNILLLSPQLQEEILSLDNTLISQIPEYKLRPILNEILWEKQRELWSESFKS